MIPERWNISIVRRVSANEALSIDQPFSLFLLAFEMIHMDEFIDQLLREERVLDIQLPRLQKRHVLEENNELEARQSVLDDDIENESTDESDEDEKEKEKEKEQQKDKGKSKEKEKKKKKSKAVEEKPKKKWEDLDRPERSPSPRYARSPSPRDRSSRKRRYKPLFWGLSLVSLFLF